MGTGNLELPQPPKALQIKQDDKFFSRLLSKEASHTNSSFRVYYGMASGAVPFVWESQPGTPKNKFCDTSLPPLTPPPSYHVHSKKNPMKKSSKFNLMHILFPKLNVKKAKVSTSPTFSLSSSSWSFSSSSTTTTTTTTKFQRRYSSSRLSFDSRLDDEEHEVESPTSILCFGGGGGGGGFRGCHSMGMMKNAFASIVGPRSVQGTDH